jgi:hypothetical protein
MSIRFSFFELKGLEDIGFKSLSDSISANPFGNHSVSGFLLEKRSESFVESRYVEKVVLADTLVDPLGNEYHQERVQYNDIKFELRIQCPQLIVWNTNAAFQSFLGRLLELSDFRLSITPLSWQPLTVVEHFQSKFDSVMVYAAVPYPLSITPSVVVRMSFEGAEDVRKHVRAFPKLKRAKFSRIKFQFQSDSRVFKCDVKENGTLMLYGETDPLVVEKALLIVDELCTQS